VYCGFKLGVGDWLVRLEHARDGVWHFGDELGSYVEDCVLLIFGVV
jgi:hypothetical protein